MSSPYSTRHRKTTIITQEHEHSPKQLDKNPSNSTEQTAATNKNIQVAFGNLEMDRQGSGRADRRKVEIISKMTSQ